MPSPPNRSPPDPDPRRADAALRRPWRAARRAQIARRVTERDRGAEAAATGVAGQAARCQRGARRVPPGRGRERAHAARARAQAQAGCGAGPQARGGGEAGARATDARADLPSSRPARPCRVRNLEHRLCRRRAKAVRDDGRAGGRHGGAAQGARAARAPRDDRHPALPGVRRRVGDRGPVHVRHRGPVVRRWGRRVGGRGGEGLGRCAGPHSPSSPPPLVSAVGYFHGFVDGVDVVFVDAPCFKGRSGGDLYSGSATDVALRNALLCRAALEAPRVVPCGGAPYGDGVVFVANDWHAALLPVYLQANYRDHGQYAFARAILVLHNVAHQVRRRGRRGVGRGRCARGLRRPPSILPPSSFSGPRPARRRRSVRHPRRPRRRVRARRPRRRPPLERA